MILGKGKVMKQESKRSIAIRSLPLPFGLAGKLHRKLYRLKELRNDQADSPFVCLVGSTGAGKTNWTEVNVIDPLIDAGRGFFEIDAAGGLTDYTIRRCAERGWPAEKFVVIDFRSPYGHPVIDFLEDDPDDDLSPYQLTEELVSATAVLSTIRSTPGARELDLARMSWLPLILRHRPLSSIGHFIESEEYREELVMGTEHPDLIRFWCGRNAYFKKLEKSVLESFRNKFNPLLMFPALRRVLDTKHSSIPLFDFMQEGGIVLVDLRETKIPLELRQTVAQLIQYWFRVTLLKRQKTDYRPPYMAIFDEFLQYRTASTIDLTRIGRQFGLQAVFLLQDMGLLSQEEYRALMTNSGTILGMNCSKNDAVDLAYELFVPSAKALYRDWEETKTLSAQEEINARIGLLQQLGKGQMIARVKPSNETWLLDVPKAEQSRVREDTVEAFLKDSAKLYYRGHGKS